MTILLFSKPKDPKHETCLQSNDDDSGSLQEVKVITGLDINGISRWFAGNRRFIDKDITKADPET